MQHTWNLKELRGLADEYGYSMGAVVGFLNWLANRVQEEQPEPAPQGERLLVTLDRMETPTDAEVRDVADFLPDEGCIMYRTETVPINTDIQTYWRLVSIERHGAPLPPAPAKETAK